MKTIYGDIVEMYERLAKNLPNTSVVMFDHEMRYILVEGAFIRRILPNHKIFVGKLPEELLNQDSLDFLLPVYRRILDGEAFSFERRTPSFSYESYASPIKNEDGAVVGGMILTHDTTEATRTAVALQVSEYRFHSLVDLAPVGIIQTDKDGNRIFCNTHWCEMAGVTLEEALKDGNQGIFADDLEIANSAWDTMMENHLPFANVLFRYVHKDGTTIWVSGNGRPIFDDKGEVTGYLGSVTNIDNQVRAQAALRESEERLRVITDNIQDIVTQQDAHGRVVFASKSSHSVLGYDPQAILGEYTLDYVHPDEQAKINKALKDAIKSGVPYITIEFRLHHNSGHYIMMESNVKFLFDDQAKYVGAVFISRDITERMRMQEMLLEQEKLHTALEKEQELGTLKTLMMQRIAHEFRTPLTIIQSSSETLTNFIDRLNPQQKAARKDAIERQIRSITDMLDQIGLAIYGSFKPNEINREAIDLSTLCREVVTELEAHLHQSGKFVVDIPESAVMSVDRQVLKRAFVNILRNAARFSSSTSFVQVQLSMTADVMELRVTDTGIGILLHEQSRIFDPFFRGSNINEVGGLGVGLPIALAAVEAHDGTIKVESVPKQGTTIIVRIPRFPG